MSTGDSNYDMHVEDEIALMGDEESYWHMNDQACEAFGHKMIRVTMCKHCLTGYEWEELDDE